MGRRPFGPRRTGLRGYWMRQISSAALLAFFTFGSISFAQMQSIKCASANQNIVATGFLDASTALIRFSAKISSTTTDLEYTGYRNGFGYRFVFLNPVLQRRAWLFFIGSQEFFIFQENTCEADVYDGMGALIDHVKCQYSARACN